VRALESAEKENCVARQCLLILVGLSFSAFGEGALGEGRMPKGSEYTNSIGMKFVRIERGAFLMGFDEGDFDERPVHEVTISRPFYIGRTEVTVEQFQQFRPDYRGKKELEPYLSHKIYAEKQQLSK
jgi:formylglycine-generating enzyme required for sulfatase activity